jgi:L-alanine-DL-glutamate epimerase-like enolase superfamily enzyme
MRITQIESQVLRLPISRPVPLPPDGERGDRLHHLFVLLVHVDTDAGHRGLGFACAVGAGRALQAIAQDDLAPLLIGEDPLDHERLGRKVFRRLQTIGRYGLVAQAYSAVDLALWDVKGKAAGLPLFKLLGGARASAPAFVGDAGWLWMSPEEIRDAAQPLIDQGLIGVKVQVGSADPEADAQRLNEVREFVGDDAWLAVDAGQRYDYATALAMGHFFEDEIGVDWFEDPISCDDIAGHARLADRLEVPLAIGQTLFGRDEFRHYLAAGVGDVLRPSVTGVGGLTEWLRVAALAELHRRPVTPSLLPEVGVQLACGLPMVQIVDYVPWLGPVFTEPVTIVNGQLVPPQRPGLGLEINGDTVEKYRLAE